MTPTTTKSRPAATGRPSKPESPGKGSQTDAAPAKGHNMNTHDDTPFKVDDLVLFRLEGAPPVFAQIQVVTDDETFPYIVHTAEHQVHVARAEEISRVYVSPRQDG